jgi:AcrR family transcriptional regulator
MAKQGKKPAEEKRPYHRGNVAEDLIAAAMRLLKSERYEDLSVRRLTREIGVTPANFYNHFQNLDDLLLQIAAAAHLRRADVVSRIIAKSATRADAARAAALDFVEHAMANPEVFRIMFGLPARIGHPVFINASDESFRTLVRLVYGADLYDPQNLEETHRRCQTAYGLFALVYGLARIVLEQNIDLKSRAETREFVDRVVTSFLDGTVGADFTRPPPELKPRAG